jgi:hypothetical protein
VKCVMMLAIVAPKVLATPLDEARAERQAMVRTPVQLPLPCAKAGTFP